MLEPIAIMLSALLGLALSQLPPLAEVAAGMILPLLMLMLVGVFAQVPLRELGAALRHPKFTGASLAVNFLWTPALAWGLGALFLRQYPELWVGLVMLLVTPCTDWYLVFTQLARGDLALATAILPWKLALQLVLLPLYLLPAGVLIPLPLPLLLESALLVLALPLAAATLLRRLKLAQLAARWQLPLLCGAIGAMFASQGQALVAQPQLLLRLLAPLLAFFGINLFVGLALGRWLDFDRPRCHSLCFAILSRNSPLALGIAVAAFPEQPLIPLVLAIGPLIELPLMALIAAGLRRLAS